LMGRIAEKYANRAYVTTDNPRSEQPEAIITEILKGFKDPSHAVVIIDRRAAIREALAALPAGAVLLIAGKGHENYQEIHGVRYHFDDLEEVRTFIAESTS
ncbi:MAG: UDP-N-acetylmuramoyl-L-alanyl-D-glutamate--2,6-diaminopimelate ligase, partial [bacterium]